MDWFRETCVFHTSSSSSASASQVAAQLPSTEGIVLGRLSSIQKTKDGIIECLDNDYEDMDAVIHRSLLKACGAVVGDKLGFAIQVNDDGLLQASAPIWRDLSGWQLGGDREQAERFPDHIGVVRQVSPAGDFAAVEVPELQEQRGKHVFVPTAVLGSSGCIVGDIVAFDVRANGKGNLQAVAPMFKAFQHGLMQHGNQQPGRQQSDSMQRPTGPSRRGRGSSGSSLQAEDFAVAEVGASEAAWEALPPTLLPWMLPTAGPAGLGASVAVCRDWYAAVDKVDLEGFWMALCAQVFPKMARSLMDEINSGDVVRSSFRKGRSSCSSQMPSSRAKVREQCSDEDQIDGQKATSREPDANVAAPLQLEEASAGLLASDMANFWRRAFICRSERQREWDAERLRVRAAKQRRSEVLTQQAVAEDKQRGQGLPAGEAGKEVKGSRATRSVRQRTCRRCGSRFLPGAGNAAESCWWHQGRFVLLDEDGVMESAGQQIDRAAVQRAITSKKKNKTEVFRATERSSGKALWTCCGAQELMAKGCYCGPHK